MLETGSTYITKEDSIDSLVNVAKSFGIDISNYCTGVYDEAENYDTSLLLCESGMGNMESSLSVCEELEDSALRFSEYESITTDCFDYESLPLAESSSIKNEWAFGLCDWKEILDRERMEEHDLESEYGFVPLSQNRSHPETSESFDKSAICELCGQVFQSYVKLKIHSMFHSNFKCAKCGEGFRMPSIQQMHTRTCSGENPSGKLTKRISKPSKN